MNDQIKAINFSIEELVATKKRLQAACNHNEVTKKYWANTGNYDPSCDGYYVDITCKYCGHKWTEEQ